VRNARLDVIETTVGVSAVLKLRTGAQPANCAAADSGTVVATITLPVDWMNAAGSGSKTILGTWEDTIADSTNTPAHFRIYESTATTCHLQGTVGQGSGDLSLDNTTIIAGQDVLITLFTLTDGNS
jgi:hypothetical protein